MKFVFTVVIALSSLTVALADETRDAQAIDSTIRAVRLLNDVDRSCSTASDCVVIALGSKACGGPSDFLIASRRNSTLPQIRQFAKISAKLEREFNERYGIVSDCMAPAKPRPTCAAGICR